jgi:hypothetical protein
MIGGLGTIVFALAGLRPALRGSRAGLVGSWLLALSAPGLDNVSDALFRLDCRAADGCTDAQQTASWHGQIHSIMGATVLLLCVAPFVLAAAFRRTPGWAGLVWPSRAVGLMMIALIVVYVAAGSHAGSGYIQRAIAVVASAWIAVLAIRVLRSPS